MIILEHPSYKKIYHNMHGFSKYQSADREWTNLYLFHKLLFELSFQFETTFYWVQREIRMYYYLTRICNRKQFLKCQETNYLLAVEFQDTFNYSKFMCLLKRKPQFPPSVCISQLTAFKIIVEYYWTVWLWSQICFACFKNFKLVRKT